MISTTHMRLAGASDGVKTGDGTGVGFFIPLDPALAAAFPDLGAEDQSQPHVTFLYVGNVLRDQEAKLVDVANTVFQGWIRGPVTGQLTDMEYFEQPAKERRVAVMRLRFSHDMAGLRWRLRDALQEAGFVVDDSFPLVYRPHTTLAYLDGLDATFDGPVPQGSWDFDGIEVWGMSKVYTAHFDKPTRTASVVAERHIDAMHHEVSVGLMKFLSAVATKLGVAKNVYVVGGAVRNFVIGQPIKDIDVVIDSVALNGRDSEWFAKQLQRAIPTHTNLTTNNYGVAILTISGDWEVGGQNLKGEVIEIANARTESYAPDTYKPEDVAPATITDDTYRREFTFNTLLWRLHDLADGPDKAEILDLTGCGLRDLQEGVMRCPSDPDKTFGDDPSRMIRAIKFLLKYGFKIAPEVEASIKRNKEKIRNIPGGHLSNMLITLFYETGVGKRALVELDKLGILEVIRSIATTDKPFREALANWAERKADVAFLFDLMDLGMPVGKSLGFLTPAQKDRVREVTVDMTADEGATFVAVLPQPRNVIDMPGLIQEFGLRGAQIRDLMVAARMALLDDPVLVASPRRWESRIRTELTASGKTAKTFTINEGDPVFFGKYKNKRGLIKDFGVSDRGDPTVVIEPMPKGRKQDLEINLFKIREDGGQKPGGPVPGSVDDLAKQVPSGDEVTADLAGHTPEYQRLTQEYNVMNRTAGWWAIDPRAGTGGMVLPSDDIDTSWGDGPADVLDAAIDKVNDHFLKEWGRVVTPDELDAGWNFSMGVIRDGKIPLTTMHERVAARYMESKSAGEWLKWIVQPFEILWKHHREFVNGPVDDAMDAIFKELAPHLVKKLLQVEVHKDVEEFLRGALAGKAGVTFDEGSEEEDFQAGYFWGRSHPEDLEHGTLPTWMKRQVVQESIRDFSHRITEQIVVATLKKVWHTINPAETFKAIKSAVRKHGWKMGVFIACVELFEHFVLPGLLAWLFDDKRWLAAVELPFGEIIYAVVARIVGSVPDEVDKPTAEGHLDWYEDAFGPVKVAAKFTDKKEVKKQDGGTMTVYEYSDKHIEQRNKAKAEQVEKLRGSIDKLRTQYRKDLTSDDEKTRNTALAVGLMDVTFERVGNDESAKDGHFGVTGWQKKHVTLSGGKATIKYVGKSGVDHVKEVTDAAIVKALKVALKGKKDNDLVCDGEDCSVGATDVNKYLAPFDVSAKDIRGFHANSEMQDRLKAVRAKGGKLPTDPKEREKKLKDEFKQALAETAEAVGHEPSTLRSQYLVPGLEEDFMDDGKLNKSFVKKAFDIDRALLDQFIRKGHTPKALHEAGIDHFRLACHYCGGVTQCRCRHESKMSVTGVCEVCLSAKTGMARVASVVDPLESAWGEVLATKTDGEKEDEGAERLVRPAPKDKPPRHDLHQEKVKESDPDLDTKDDDLSLNYKKVAYDIVAINKRQQKKNDKKNAPPPPPKPKAPPKPKGPPPPPGGAPKPAGPAKKEEPEHKPGDVWKTDDGYAAKNMDGVSKGGFEDKGRAEAYAKGKPVEEAPDEGGDATKPDASTKADALAKAMDDANTKKMDQALKALKTDHPDLAGDVDALMKEYWAANADYGKAIKDLDRSKKDVDIKESEAAMDKAEKARKDVADKVRGLTKAPKSDEAPKEEAPAPKEEAPPPPTKDEDKELDKQWEGEAPKSEEPTKAPTEEPAKTDTPPAEAPTPPAEAPTPPTEPPAAEPPTAEPPPPAEPEATPEATPSDAEPEAPTKKPKAPKAPAKPKAPTKVPEAPLVIGDLEVSDEPKTTDQLIERGKAAMKQYAEAEPAEQKKMLSQLKYGLTKAKKGTARYKELTQIAEGMDLASIAKDGTQLEVGDGDDRQLLTEQKSDQYLALGKALGRTGKAGMLLDVSSDDPNAFYGPKGREAINAAMNQKDFSDADLVQVFGADAGLSSVFGDPKIPDATKDVLRKHMKDMVIDNMTTCHAALMSSYCGPENSAAVRKLKDDAQSGDAANVLYKDAPMPPEEVKRILGKVKDEDQASVQRYMQGQFSLGYNEHHDRIMAEVKKLTEADPEANPDLQQIGGMNAEDAEAALERARRLHLKYLHEVMQKPEFKRTPAQKLQEFLTHAEPETRERMKGVSPDEFMEIMGAIMASGSGESTTPGKTAGEAEFFRQWFSYKWPVTA